MKIVQMVGNRVHWITPWTSWDDVPDFAPDIVLKEVPDEVEEGWALNEDGTFSEYVPTPEEPPEPPEYLLAIIEKINAILAGMTPPITRPDVSPFEVVALDLFATSIQLADNNPDRARMVASIAAPMVALTGANPWQEGMTTGPGDRVLDPEGRYTYIFTGIVPMTHHNPLFFPGAAGVFHWAIVPDMHQGYRVYPDIEGIIVAVRHDEIWWNTDLTQRYRWNSVDNNAVVWPPGTAGVHQWEAVE